MYTNPDMNQTRVFPSLSSQPRPFQQQQSQQPSQHQQHPQTHQPPKQSPHKTSYTPSLSKPNSITNQYAMIFTYKRILLSLFGPPIITFITPYLFSKTLSLFNYLSGGCALGSFFVSMCIINCIYSLIRLYAPSVDKCEDAIDSIRYRLEFWVLLFVSLLSRYGMSMVGGDGTTAGGGGDVNGSWMAYMLQAEFLNMHLGIRVSLALFVLSLLITSRFVGYFAIVQCSTFPLPNNPYQTIVNKLTSFTTSFDQILMPDQQQQHQVQQQQQQQQPPQQHHHHQQTQQQSTITNQNANTNTATQSISNRQIHKRYSKPAIPQAVIQMIINLMAGLLFGYLILPETYSNSNADAHRNVITTDLQYLFLLSCSFTSAFIYMVTYYSGNNGSNTNKATTYTTSTIMMNNTTVNANTITTNRKDVNYHELSFDKKTLPYITLSSLLSVIYDEVIEQIQASSVLFYWIISPFLAFGLIHIVNGPNLIAMMKMSLTTGDDRKMLIVTMMTTYLTTLIMCLYMMTIDICTRKFLMTRGLNIHTLVSQSNVVNVNSSISSGFSGSGSSSSRTNVARNSMRGGIISGATQDMGNEIIMEDLIVSLILAGLGTEIIDDVTISRLVVEKDGNIIRHEIRKSGEVGNRWEPSSTHSYRNMDMEEEEVRRNNVMMDRVAASILTGGVCGHSSFEEDLLKFIILESLGGGNGPSIQQNQDALVPFEFSGRHYNTLMRYLNTIDLSSGMPSIVRALCAYAGGMGEALSQISSDSPLSGSTSAGKDTFSLPSCACLAGTNAIKAAARLVILNMTNTKTRFNRLSLFVPVILETTYKLRCGILDFVHFLYDSSESALQFQQEVRGETFGNFLAIKCPELSKVLTACDDCGVKILHFMRMVDGKGACTEVSELKVNDNVKDWLKSLLK